LYSGSLVRDSKAEESALALDLKMERIKAIQQEILQSDIFKKLGELESSTWLLSTSLAKGLDI
jgi:hypothetical protein